MSLDVSIIIPYYNKYDEFKFALDLNKDQFEKVNEVIIVCDEVIGAEKFTFLLDYNIKFKVFSNTENHEWRNPAPVINHGLKEASSKYCIIISPESILCKDAIKILLDNTDDNSYCMGKVMFFREDRYYSGDDLWKLFDNPTVRTLEAIGPVYYGSICCSKSNFEKVNYYTEDFINWGGEDTDVRTKLIKNGLIAKKLDNVKVIHLEDNNSFNKRFCRSQEQYFTNNNNLYKKFIRVDLEPISNSKFIDKINKIGEITEYELKKNIYSYYPVILLTQSYNEQYNVTEFLENVGCFVDGIICLDDSSTDNTWNLVKSDKLLIKFKKNRISFNDLENRNLLLKVLEKVFIENNIYIQWFIWLDFDERIDTNPVVLTFLKKLLFRSPNYIYNIPLLHMWNDKEYNADYPRTENGIQLHTRLIKNDISKLPYSIINPKKLHFRLIPYISGEDIDHLSIYPLLIKHKGRISEELRKYKYDKYTNNYDIDLNCQGNYDHFLENNVTLLDYSTNKYNSLFRHIDTLIPVIIYDNYSDIETMTQNIIGCIKIRLKTTSLVPIHIDYKHMVIPLISSPKKCIDITSVLHDRDCTVIGGSSRIDDIIKYVNKRYAKKLKKKKPTNDIHFVSLAVLNGKSMGIVDKDNLSYNICDTIRERAENLFNKYKCKDYLLVDFVVRENIVLVKRINVCPSFALDSPFIKSILGGGVTRDELFIRLFRSACIKQNKVFIG
jgi:hypothetical protein